MWHLKGKSFKYSRQDVLSKGINPLNKIRYCFDFWDFWLLIRSLTIVYEIFLLQVNVAQFMTTLPTCTMSWVSGGSSVIIIIIIIIMMVRYGDVINIHHKQEDGWWVGECTGTIGIFPATYVETIWPEWSYHEWWKGLSVYSFILTKKSLCISSSFARLHLYECLNMFSFRL